MPDPYLDSNTGVLSNLIGALTAEELAYRESQIVFANAEFFVFGRSYKRY